MATRGKRRPGAALKRGSIIYSNFDEAWTATEAALKAGQPDGPHLPIYQWNALEEISGLKVAFDRGDKVALFAAMKNCAQHGLVMPEWVSRAFLAGYRKVISYRVGSWDEAFGRPHPKGKHLDNLREDREKQVAIAIHIRRLVRSEGRPIDDALFEEVGKKFGMAKTRCNRLYYEAKKKWFPAEP
jgi:hypothetical protein